MKVAAVTVLEYSRSLDGRSWNPAFRWTERRAPLVVVEADNGLSGIGEAWGRQASIGLVLARLADVVAPAMLGVEVVDAASIARIAGRLRLLAPAGTEPWISAAAASAI